MNTMTGSPPSTPAQVRGPAVTLWLLRIALVLHMLAVLTQPVLAGWILAGDVDAIAIHGAVGSGIATLAVLVAVASLLYVIARGRVWVLPVAVLLFLGDGTQIGFGYTRSLDMHIPLGVAIVLVSVLLVIWSFTPSASRARRPLRRARADTAAAEVQ